MQTVFLDVVMSPVDLLADAVSRNLFGILMVLVVALVAAAAITICLVVRRKQRKSQQEVFGEKADGDA